MNNSIRRIYTLSYLPSGFFSRLITRILCDNILKECLLELIELKYCNRTMPKEDDQDTTPTDGDTTPTQSQQHQNNDDDFDLEGLIDFVSQEAEWKCWQSGIELKYLDYTLIRVKELIQDPLITIHSDMNSQSAKNELFISHPVLYRDCENEFKLKFANKQCFFIEAYASMANFKIIKLKVAEKKREERRHNETIPHSDSSITNNDYLSSSKTTSQLDHQNDDESDILIKILSRRQVCVKIFALIIEIIDSLLEDWYPDLGTRFMQDSRGDYLVTRLTPCEKCVELMCTKQRRDTLKNRKNSINSNKSSNSINESLTNYDEFLIESANVAETSLLSNSTSFPSELAMGQHKLGSNEDKASTRTSTSTSTSDQNEYEIILMKLRHFESSLSLTNNFSSKMLDWIYCFMIDDISYSVLKNAPLNCPRHGLQLATQIAPDLAFEDIDEKRLVTSDMLKIEQLLGRGSFGSVFSGSLHYKKTADIDTQQTPVVRVAVKLLESLNKKKNASVDGIIAGSNQDDLPNMSIQQLINTSKDQAPQGGRKQMEMLNKYWNYRKAIRMAAKAYTVARQEISIVSSLKHDNIVGMLGLSVQPLAIILELAPLGNLKDILGNYKVFNFILNYTNVLRTEVDSKLKKSPFHLMVTVV
jgi:hypothetical protein